VSDTEVATEMLAKAHAACVRTNGLVRDAVIDMADTSTPHDKAEDALQDALLEQAKAIESLRFCRAWIESP
jgi:hypothetical protein